MQGENYYDAYFALYNIYSNDFINKMAHIASAGLKSGGSKKEVLVC